MFSDEVRAVMNSIRLLSTDFDGTLISHDAERICPASFAKALEDHKQNGGFWVINTGRSLDHMIEGLVEFNPPIAPDFLIVNERHIHTRNDLEWASHESWNTLCDEVHEELLFRSGGLLQELKHFANTRGGVELIHEESGIAGLVTSCEVVMQDVVDFLNQARDRVPGFDFQRNAIYLRFSHTNYTKGSALFELSRILQVDRKQVLAIGDNYNDLAMLSGEYAELVACPANAVPRVKEIVTANDGYVARQSFGAGSAEAYFHFLKIPSGAEFVISGDDAINQERTAWPKA